MSKKRLSKTHIQQPRQAIKSHFCSQFSKPCGRTKFSSATPLVITSLLFFIAALENLAFQSEAKTKNLFIDIQTTLKNKLGSILAKHTQCQNRCEIVKRFDMNQHDCENENYFSTQFIQTRKNQLIDLQEHL